MKPTLFVVASLTPLLFASRTFAQDDVGVVIETYCSDNEPSGNIFSCVGDDDRIWGTATNLEVPHMEEKIPGWPDVHNYFTVHTLTSDDTQRCIDTTHSYPIYETVPDDKIFVTCTATAEVFSYPILESVTTMTVPFGDPLEHGKVVNPDGSVEWVGALAKVLEISCGCVAFVPGEPSI